ncbi:MAG: zf-HC2 domain-containing protein [Acidobacteriota bacterium]|nr:zf-HC2 domain-containing protein [Acidobacteriota bacterium]
MMHAVCCEDVQNRLDEFHDDELTVDERVAIQGHLRDCVTCALAAAELDEVRDSLREAAMGLPDRSAPEAECLSQGVVERVRVEAQLSWAAALRTLFQDMHLVWAALGATAATLVCLLGSLSVFHATSQERPGSLADLISFLANPGSNENPVRLDSWMRAPRWRADGAGLPLSAMPGDDAVLALSAVVTREGRVQNLELLSTDRAAGVKVRPDVLLAMLQAAYRVEFEPAKVASTGDPIAVSMVWLLASTTVKGVPSDELVIVRRPADGDMTGPHLSAQPAPAASAPPRPVTDESLLL